MTLFETWRHDHSRLAHLLPWVDFVAPGVVLNRDPLRHGRESLMATLQLTGPDLRAQPRHILGAAMLQVNNWLQQLEWGWALQSETQRSWATLPPPAPTWGHPVAQLVDEESRAALTDLLVSRHYVTLTYEPPSRTRDVLESFLVGRTQAALAQRTPWQTYLSAFQTLVAHLVRLLRYILVAVEPLDDTATYRFLDFG